MRKIMFSDKYDLTKAVLEGRKTMTRRIVPECKALDILRIWERNEGAVATGYEEKTQSFRFDYCPDKRARISIDHLNLTPRYKVGEVVAVAQSYGDITESVYGDDEMWKLDFIRRVEDAHELLQSDIKGWNNKMFVRADLMPYQIRITNIRVERLQDISDEDCLREGIQKDGDTYWYKDWEGFRTARRAFADLIDNISGKSTWISNPWVFVYEFELVK